MIRPLTTLELHEQLERRVLGPEGQGERGYLFEEVPFLGRRVDAIGVGAWLTRGRLIDGFEIKASRADWELELRNPAKSAPALSLCDRFWLVTNSGIVRDGELPESWGLLVAGAGGLEVVTPAPLLRDPHGPLMSREALVRLLHCAFVAGRRTRLAPA